jgi:beta-hydroxylase
MYMFPAVPNRPMLQLEMVPELKLLRDNWQTMREEARHLFAQGAIKAADKYNDWGFNSFFRSGWKRFYLKKRYGAPLPSSATSSLRLPVSIPAQIVIRLAIFRDPPLMRT